MIFFNSETTFDLEHEEKVSMWLGRCIANESKSEGTVTFVFCDDNYLYDINVKYLKHNSLTDIISFDYTMGNTISGDIFISVTRVLDNSKDFKVSFAEELHRVMIHGVLHFCGYTDKTVKDKALMRAKEDYYLSLRTF